jgi:UDP-N-acetylmuramoylalanine--D-glutamate ligase
MDQFKGKKIMIMGLGLLGGALNDAIYLAEHGALLTVTDIKTSEQLKSSVQKLKKYKNIKFVLGGHNVEDFKSVDMIIQPGNVPGDSPYLLEAKRNHIPVFVSESLFAKYAGEVTLVGITGTRGKSMTTALIYEILKQNEKFLTNPSATLGTKKPSVFLGGNVRNVSTLALLDKIKPGDIVVMELDSWALHGMGDIKKSPQISVFTSFMPDHMNYYKNSMEDYFKDKANIFRYQKTGDILVTSKEVKKLITHSAGSGQEIKSKIILADKKDVLDFQFIVPGEHQRQNLAYAVKATEQFRIPVAKIRKTVANFKGIEGRLQYLKTIKGFKIYNDNNATTPEATIAGIKALSPIPGIGEKKIVLICGGADKKLDLTNFIKIVNKNCKAVVLIPGTGTDTLITNYELRITNEIGKNLKDVVRKAIKYAKKGDIILFSPAFASFGMFANEYDRGDQFVKIIKKLK